MSTIPSFRVRAFGCTIDFAAENDRARASLDQFVFPQLLRENAGDSAADLTLRMEPREERFRLWVNGQPVAEAEQPRELADAAINAIDETVIRCMRGLHAVHAGAVSIGGRGLLLPGGTHAGKSSLVAELLRRGARYFSDEYALIDAAGRVHAYPRPLLMRNGSRKQFPMLPEECDSQVASSSAPVGWILFVEYRPEATWGVREISQSEAVLSLLKNTPHALAEAPEMVGSFERAVCGAVCMAGERGQAADAASEILRLVETSL
jgi:hypothetical protein